MTSAEPIDHAILTSQSLQRPLDKAFIGTRELEVSMKRGLLAPLSPNEQTALRRVASGITKPKHLRTTSVDRLMRLALVEEHEGRIRLTALGEQRCLADMPAAPSSTPVAQA